MYYSAEDILREKLKQFTLLKNKPYTEQLENKLRYLSELYQSTIPVLQASYKVTEEFSDVVIVKKDKHGNIQVFPRK